MKRLVGMVLIGFTLVGCSNYDPYRITQTQRHKDTTHELVMRAREGKLTRIEYESGMQSFDTSMIEEQSKKGSDIEKLKKVLDDDSEKKIVELFGEE